MSDALNHLLRPLVKFFFDNLYPRIPLHRKILWFFCKHYFVKGYDSIAENWQPLEKKMFRFTAAGYRIMLNYCTEDAEFPADAKEAEKIYGEIIDRVAALRLADTASLSIKLSQFGCFSNDASLACCGLNAAESVVRYAGQKNIRIVFDGEQLKYAPAVKIFSMELAKKYKNIGIRAQAYDPYFVEETTRFVETNLRKKNIIPLSVCKGAYDEPDALSERETGKNILWAARYCRTVDYPVELDTNDGKLVRTSRAIYVGLLYGVKPKLARNLKQDGYRVSIYFPIIKEESGHTRNPRWEQFAIRRLIERPLYLLYPVKSLADKIFKENDYF